MQLPQPTSTIDRFKAFLKKAGETEVDLLSRDESLPRGAQRRNLGDRAISDTSPSQITPQRSFGEVVQLPESYGSGVNDATMQALQRARESGKFNGTDDQFFRAAQRHGQPFLDSVPQQGVKGTSTIASGLNEGTPKQYADLITRSAQANGVPERLLSSLIKQESGFNPNAKSPAGALGIAQFMPATAKGFGIDPLDPNQAIPAAALYLKRSYDKFGSWELALAAYNAGGGAVGKYGGIPPFPETQRYVKNIMAMSGGGQ